jgi:nitrogen regulatory protein P-II 1
LIINNLEKKMKGLSLITCIVQRGKADKIVDAALNAGAQGATMFFGRGTGVRQKLGMAAAFIAPEKEIILIVTKKNQTEEIFEMVTKEAKLEQKGMGFAFVHSIDSAVGFLDED